MCRIMHASNCIHRLILLIKKHSLCIEGYHAKVLVCFLEGAKNLTVEQLSVVETLYDAELDSELEEELRVKGFRKLIEDEPKDEP